MNFPPEVNQVLTDLTEKLREETPEIMAVIDKGKRGELNETQVMMQLVALIQATPGLEQKIMAMAHTEMISLRDAPSSIQEGLPTAVYTNPTSGLPSLNPLYEAALIEKAQFDGDIPELRTGPLPEGAKAAVPVLTTARSQVAIGQMLQKASDEVTQAIEEHEKKRLAGINAQIEPELAVLPSSIIEINEDGTIGGNLIPLDKQTKDLTSTVELDQMKWGSAETDLAIYKRGQVPEHVEVAVPTGSDLLKMEETERQKCTWGFVSTTQGRRSALTLLQQDIQQALEKNGWEITSRKGSFATDTIADCMWVFNVEGPLATQSGFSFLNTSSQVLIKGLIKRLESVPKQPLVLEVLAVGDSSSRVMGWIAKLFPQEAANGK
jgi:hypothetical protein